MAETLAVEREHRGVMRSKHAAYLVVLALREGEECLARRHDFQDGGRTRLLFTGKDERAGGKERDEIRGQVTIDRGAINLGNLVLWRRQSVYERRLIREQQQAAGLLVETADAGDNRIALPPPGREQRVDAGAFAAIVRADEPEGFVEEEQQAVGVVKRLVIDAHVGGENFLGGAGGKLTAHRDALVVDHAPGFAAAAVAEVGEKLVEAAHEE